MHFISKKRITLFGLFLFFLFAGCSESSTNGSQILYPETGLHFMAYPNDRAQNDSLAFYLAKGIFLKVHPVTNYQISFEKDQTQSSPEMQLFRLIFNNDSSTYRLKLVRKIKAEEQEGRLFYSFTCEESQRSYWAATLLGENGSYYLGNVKNFLFEGGGSFSNHLNLNLIVTGKYGGTADSVSEEQLARTILNTFRTYLKPGGIEVDTIFIRRAENHPELGPRYPSGKPWYAGTSSKDYLLSELGGWPEDLVYDALDLILVHRIDEESVLGYSLLFGGSLGGGSGSTVVIGTHYLQGIEEFILTSESIAMTALHESAHFFGIRHTSATRADLEISGDYSNKDDGLSDTPFCQMLNYYSSTYLLKSDFKIFPRVLPAQALNLYCPDMVNIMFPYVVDDIETSGFSEQQLELLRLNLEIFPH